MKLIIDDACYAYQQIFADFGEITAMPGRDIDPQALRQADVLIVRSRTQVNQDLLAASQVKFVGSAVAGLEHIEQDYLKAKHIQFFSAQGCNAMAVAEFVISAIVNLAAELGFDYQQKTLGIIGVGNVGSRLAAKAQLMGIKTLCNDPPRQNRENLPDFIDLNTALSADIVSFHTPLTISGAHSSYHLLNTHNFHHITPQTILINTARGGIIDEQVWAKTKTLANVIDCWENEPNINKTLQKSAYLATPHIAGHSLDAKFMGSFMVYNALCRFTKKQANSNIIKLIKPGKLSTNEANIKDTLNKIYNFKNDSTAIHNIKNFEHYRRNYPPRYEWHHYKNNIALPIA